MPTVQNLRLATYSVTGESGSRVGAVLDDHTIVDLGAEAATQGRLLTFDASDMISLIAAGPGALAEVASLVSGRKLPALPLNAVKLHSPIPRPRRNIFCVGWNYLEHFAEGQGLRADPAQQLPEHPVFFTKCTNAMNGPFDAIPFDPAVSDRIDWEGELAVVIGKGGKNIREERALEHVFGFSVMNDVSARDVQQKRHGGQWFKGKSLDGHAPMGPWIVVADTLDYDRLQLVTRVNGVVKQDASTAQMYFKVPRIIAELSLGLTLEPGDIISTGTPPGVGFARQPPEFLRPGDVMETEIEGIGLMRNAIAAA